MMTPLSYTHRRVLISGATGFIGKPLVERLLGANHTVCILTRSPVKAEQHFQGRVRCIQNLDELGSTDIFDVVINLAGAPIAGGLWTEQRKQLHFSSRIDTTDALVAWVRKSSHRPEVWVQASAIGYYGVRDSNERLDEQAQAGQGFMADLCARWEASAHAVDALNVRRVTMRLGVVLGPHGGALQPMLLPFQLGFGGRMGHGQQVMSWIHLDDVIQLILRVIDDTQWHGTYNAVAPEAVTQATFAQHAGALLKRPVWLPIPAAPFRMLLGEMAQLFFDGQHVVPTRLVQAGFPFRYPTLESALRASI
jgi:uncharacterized protein (TIGR01777 family)